MKPEVYRDLTPSIFKVAFILVFRNPASFTFSPADLIPSLQSKSASSADCALYREIHKMTTCDLKSVMQ